MQQLLVRKQKSAHGQNNMFCGATWSDSKTLLLAVILLLWVEDRDTEDESERQLKEKKEDKLWESQTGMHTTIDGGKLNFLW